MKPLVLIIEDQKNIRKLISTVLTANNYQVIDAEMGKDGLSMVKSYAPDIVLLDLGLPDINGLEVLKAIRRQSNTPVIVDSANGNEEEVIKVLDMGADYIKKPFTVSELLAQLQTTMRRNPKSMGDSDPGKTVIGRLEIDYSRKEVFLSGQKICLTPVEYKLLELLSKNAGRTLTYNFIISKIWGSNIDGRQALHMNMADIRRKIESNPAMPQYILSEINVGYRMIGET